LGLSELRVTTVSTNRPVLSLNRKLGFRQTGITKNAQMIGGQAVDLVHFLLDGKDWPKVRAGVLPLAQVAEKQVRVWERAER
jgi:RimJ/RimL family protein N-acetyltransferase